MNKGLSSLRDPGDSLSQQADVRPRGKELNESFPGIIAEKRPIVVTPNIPDPN